MSSPFIARRHNFPGQHIREYPAALANDQEDILTVAANSYTPCEVDDGSVSGDMTIIGFHANAFPKEVYEPFFEALYHCLKFKHGMTIGSIWIAEQAAQGDSALLNDDKLGNDSHWFDHSRDVIQMVNTFRSQMRRPLVGIGHSMGGTQAVATATFHPRLFEALVLLDTAMSMTLPPSMGQMVLIASRRPETFASKEEAMQYVRKSPIFKGWDPRALRKYTASAFHQARTTLYPDDSVKQKTSNFSEIRAVARPNPDFLTTTGPVSEEERYTYPDLPSESPMLGPIYNVQSRQGYRWLSSLRPPTLFVLGQGSRICPPEELKHRTNITGTDLGGSGGVEAGNVESVTISGGHFLPMTSPQGTAESSAGWIADRIQKWRTHEESWQKDWKKKSLAEKQKLEPRVQNVLRKWDGVPWNNPNALPDGGRSKL